MKNRKKKIRQTIRLWLAVYLIQLLASPFIFSVSVGERVFTKENSDPLHKKQTQPNNTNQSEFKDVFKSKTTVKIPSRVIYKDPRLACLLSFIVPGSGEIYLRNDVKGITFCLSTTSAYLLSFYFIYVGFVSGGAEGKSKLIAGGIGTVAALVLHTVGIVESYNDAVEINEARFYNSE